MEERILNKATEQYFSFGLRSVTMDALASELGISKKTLYRYFPDKDKIIERVITHILDNHKQEIECCRADAADVVHEVFLQMEGLLKVFLGIHPGFFNEVQRYYPAIWENVLSYEREALLNGIRMNLEKGIAEGVYRSEIDINITAFFRLNQLKSLFTPAVYEVSYHDIKALGFELTSLYLHGIASSVGRQLINNYSELQLQQ